MRLENTQARNRQRVRTTNRTCLLSTISKILLYLILAILLLFVVLTVVFPKLVGASTYTVLTGSMRPSLEPGHLIGVRPTPVEALQIGDVITYQLESGKPMTVTHRVVGKSQTSSGEITFTTQGDANNVVDALPVQEAQIRGKLVYAIPVIGRVTNLLNPQTKAVVTTVLGIGIILYGVSFFLPKRAALGRRTASGVGVVLLAGTYTLGPGLTPVQAAPQIPEIEVSRDGVNWEGAVTVDIFPDAGLIIPGQTVSAQIWVKNTTGHSVSTVVTGTWSNALEGSTGEPDDPLWDRLELSYGQDASNSWEIFELAPNDVMKGTVQVTFSEQAGGHQNSSAQLNLVVSAQEVIATDSPVLAETGLDLGQAVWFAGLALLAGFGLLISTGQARASR